MGTSTRTDKLKVADEVWIATALLLRDDPTRTDVSVADIVERAREEFGPEPLRPGVYVHAVQHCVAGRPASPGRYRMLVETGRNRRRLYRPGDRVHPSRQGARSKSTPQRADVPARYHQILDWYETEYLNRDDGGAVRIDPLLALRESPTGLWADEDPDAYVARLRQGWL